MRTPSASFRELPVEGFRDHGADLADARFRQLIGPTAWSSLPSDVRRRFSKRPGVGATTVYTGHVLTCAFSRAGWLLAQGLRLIGGPLPLSATPGGATVVTVTEDAETGGQHWTRIYCATRGFPQVIHSTKCFSGTTGLEERIGFGIAMALTVNVRDEALVFVSAGYCVRIAGYSLVLPRWLSPGETTVAHRAVGPAQFVFTLTLRHPVFGILLHQEALYRDNEPCRAASC